MRDSDGRAILILGMHRSGTSALTRAINLSGWHIPQTLMRSSEANETGHWESVPIARTNDAILAALDRHWADPKPIAAKRFSEPAIARFGSEIRAVIASEFEGAKQIVIKDPRLSRLLPLWTDALSSSGYRVRSLVACRNPLEIASSLHKRDGMKREHALLLWQSYILDAERHSRGVPRALVAYDELLSDWRKTLFSAMSMIGEPITPELADARSIDQFLDANQRHAEIPAEEFLSNPDFAPAFKSLFASLLDGKLMGGSDPFDQLSNAWRLDWEERSRGPGPSAFATTLPVHLIKKSRQADKAGEHQSAIELARKAVAMDPSISRHHYYLGQLLARHDNLEEATEAFQRAIALYPRSAPYHRDLSDVFRRLGRMDDAVGEARQAVKYDPDNSDFQIQLDELLLSDR